MFDGARCHLSLLHGLLYLDAHQYHCAVLPLAALVGGLRSIAGASSSCREAPTSSLLLADAPTPALSPQGVLLAAAQQLRVDGCLA